MLKKTLLLLGAFATLFFFSSAPVSALDNDWIIESFYSQITVNQDSSVNVEETLEVNFASLAKHGIFREIPIVYRDNLGNRLNIRLKVKSVSDGKGSDLKYKITRRGNQLEIKIGDPDKTISGKQIYRLSYSVQKIITRFANHDELYFNVTGSNWPVPILFAGAEVAFPSAVTDTACFSGPTQSRLANCTSASGKKTAIFQTDKKLYPGEGLTIVAAVPKGTIAEITTCRKIIWFFTDNWPYTLPVFTLLILLRIYWVNGRDKQYKTLFDPTRGSQKLPFFTTELVPTAYSPLQDIKPAEAGTLIDEQVNIRDVAATIIDLAVRGYLKIKEIEKSKLFKTRDYKITLINNDLLNLEPFEEKLILGLFGKSKTGNTAELSSLKYNFNQHLEKIKDDLYQKMVDKGYFRKRPDRIIKAYLALGSIIIALGFFLFSLSLSWAFAFIVSGIMVLLFSKAMPGKTALGRKQFLRVLGLRNFVSLGAYREQLWERANIFEEVMPYAIAFNLTHKWAEAFEKASLKQPQWYQGTTPFNANTFAYSLESFTRTTTSTLPSVKSAASGGSGFGGGGFSGGGFSGGGGGSW